MDTQLIVGLAALIAGGSVGFVIWWCWGRLRPAYQCESCGEAFEALVTMREPGYALHVCAGCAESLRRTARVSQQRQEQRTRRERVCCERCAVEGERLVRVRVNSRSGPSYEMLVCETCVAELRELGPSRRTSRTVERDRRRA